MGTAMPDITFVGEAYGEREEWEQTPFVGPAGYELTRMLEEAGIHRANCFLTNVFNLRPPGNKIEALCGGKDDAIEGYPVYSKGRYIRQEFRKELDRLTRELLDVNSNLLVALGNTATWALSGRTTISRFRGTTSYSTHTVRDFKVLATYHPAVVLRQWELRPTTVADLIKAKRESAYPDIRRPKREIWIEPTLEDIYEFHQRYIKPPCSLSVDIETSGRHISCIGLAPSQSIALVIPFYDPRRLGSSYWPTASMEVDAWNYIRQVLGDKRIRKVFQNGVYDIAFLWRTVGIPTLGAEDDTMLLHHALQPEALKSLGYLGSIYTDEGAWKQMRTTQTLKRDE